MGTGSGLDQELGQLLPPDIEASECDKIGRRIIFRKPYKVHISDRRMGQPNQVRCGTQMVLKIRIAWGQVTGSKVALRNWYYTLDSHASVFQAEVRAIAECAAVQLTKDNWGCPISIFSASRAALMALNCTSIYSMEVLQGSVTLHRYP